MRRLIHFFRTDIGIGLAVALGWQFFMLVVGTAIALHTNTSSISQALTGHMVHWDAGWYQQVIAHAYGPAGNPAAPAFYPLFPLLVWCVSFISFGIIDHPTASLLINTIALWWAIVALVRILRYFHIPQMSIRVGVALFLSFPAALFMHVMYGEAIFVALGFWAYMFALQRRWWLVGTLLGTLTAARLPAVLFVGLCVLEYLRSYDWSIRRAFNPRALWLMVAPIGFLAYGTYLLIVRHDFLAMFHAYAATSDWSYQVFSPNVIATIGHSIETVGNALITYHPTYDIFINNLVPLAAIIALIVGTIYGMRRIGTSAVPLGVMGIVAVVMFTLNSNTVSVHRYILPCLVLYVAGAYWARPGWRIAVAWTTISCCFLLQLYLYYRFITNAFAG